MIISKSKRPRKFFFINKKGRLEEVRDIELMKEWLEDLQNRVQKHDRRITKLEK